MALLLTDLACQVEVCAVSYKRNGQLEPSHLLNKYNKQVIVTFVVRCVPSFGFCSNNCAGI